jgi:hypothetical protein
VSGLQTGVSTIAQPLSEQPEHSARPQLAVAVDRFAAAIERHWLFLLLAVMLIVTGLPFLAPIFMSIGWTGPATLLYTLYTPFCHRLPQRSWFLLGEKLTYTLDEINRVYPSTDSWQLRLFYGTPEMGWKVAWSDRMISFYTMTPVFGLLYAALGRGRLRPIHWRVFVLALLPLDGATHIFSDLISGVSSGGFRDTNIWLAALTGNAFPTFYAGDHFGTFNWWARLLTGLLAAWGIAFFAFPWLDKLFQRQTQKSARNP